jgi:RHS repeat-associated protein
VDYVYDAFNQLVNRVVDPDGIGSAPLDRTINVYDDEQVVLEFRKAGSGNIAASDLSHRYLWGPAVDQLMADEQVDWVSDGDADGEVLWALTDNLGSVRDVVDSNGDARIHRHFDPFGKIIEETHYNGSGAVVTVGSGYVDEAFAFTGRYFDVDRRLQNNLYRWYDPSVGRWLSEDPIGFAGGDENLYGYANNSPTGFVDSDGLAANGVGQYLALQAAPVASAIAAHRAEVDRVTAALQRLQTALSNPSNGRAVTAARAALTKAMNQAQLSAGRVSGAIRDFRKATVGLTRVRGEKANDALYIVQNASRTVSANTQYLDLVKRLDTIYRNSPLLSGRCETAARATQKVLQDTGQKPELLRITGSHFEDFFVIDGQKFAERGVHIVVRSGDRIYDAATGPAGLPIDQYLKFLADNVNLIDPILEPIK